MYTLEERKAAVALLIATNFNEGLVIKTLGYPSPNALRQWYREYQKTGTLHDKCRPKARFTKEQIDEYYLTHGNCIIDTCRALGYPNRGTLAMWLNERFPGGIPGAKVYCKAQRSSVKLTREEKYRAVERIVVSHEPEYKVYPLNNPPY